MTSQPTPDEIRRATFRVVFRGYEQSEVEARLDEAARAVADLIEQRDRLSARLGEFAERDLKSEFEKVGEEVASVLESARAAAETMRERATADAARWRSETMAEVEAMRKEARGDAEALRSDAWATGSQLLDQVMAEAESLRSAAEQDSLSVRGEAEREAHRLAAGARRESEDLVRTAKMESERLVAQARAEHDEIIATAHRQAEAAQERTRALEQRRQELMTEIEQVRAALSSFEGELEDRRQGIGLSEPGELPRRAVVSDEEGTHVEDWEEGHTVRVIRPGPREEALEPEDADADALAEEVARLRAEADAADQALPEPEPPEEPPAAEEELAEEAPGEELPASEEAEIPAEEAKPPQPAPSGGDDVSELFRRLRTPLEEAEDNPQPEPQRPLDIGERPEEPDSHAEVVDVTTDITDGTDQYPDPFETRERLLLPLTNGALRSVKRKLTEAQNEALDQLRVTDGDWNPESGAMGELFTEELAGLTESAGEAGLEAAKELGVDPSGDYQRPSRDLKESGEDLVAAVAGALKAVGGGSRERSAAASRVFRGWRTDEAERRVRSVALASYHDALRWALERDGRKWKWVPAGRLCPTCRQAAEAGDEVPPAHRDCNCTIVPT